MILYHATFRTNLSSIKKLGLGAKQPKNWDISKDRVVCFATDPEVAFSYCECAEDVSESKYDSGIVVLGVNTNYLSFSKLDVDRNNQGEDTYEYSGIINPNLLYVVTSRDGEFKNAGKLLDLKRVPSFER